MISRNSLSPLSLYLSVCLCVCLSIYCKYLFSSTLQGSCIVVTMANNITATPLLALFLYPATTLRLTLSLLKQHYDYRLSGVKDSSSMWLHGYWGFDWADNYVRVVKLDGATSTITTDSKTLPLYGKMCRILFID